jgi:hypothetical protein
MRTMRSDPASARTASTARANKSIENLPSFGDALLPWPGRSIVITRYFFANAGICADHDELSHVHPCTKTSVAEPVPLVDEWIARPSTDAAVSDTDRALPRTRAQNIFLMALSLSVNYSS